MPKTAWARTAIGLITILTISCGGNIASESVPEEDGEFLAQANDGTCSIYADNHLDSSRNHLSWQIDANCGRFVSAMKITWSVLKDGGVWYGDSQRKDSNGAMHLRDTPLCSSGSHSYVLRATLNYFHLTTWKSLSETSISIRCTR